MLRRDGSPPGQRRRTPGLRREEVAELADLSTTWYTWLEQGRNVQPSTKALDRIAKALQLTSAQRAYLFRLAAIADPDPSTAMETQPSPWSEVVGHIDCPAYVLDELWNALAWNKSAEWLFKGWLDEDNDRNLLIWLFRSPASRDLVEDWQGRARRIVAELRADWSRNMQNQPLRDLIGRLTETSPDFRAWWEDRSVLDREGGIRVFNHPTDGRQTFRQNVFQSSVGAGTRLVILTGAQTD